MGSAIGFDELLGGLDFFLEGPGDGQHPDFLVGGPGDLADLLVDVDEVDLAEELVLRVVDGGVSADHGEEGSVVDVVVVSLAFLLAHLDFIRGLE